MAIRVIEVPSSVRFDPPPRPCLEDRREPTISMKKPVGVLGWTPEEHEEHARTKKGPTRQVEAPEAPPGLSLTSLPSREYLRGVLDTLRKFSRRGPKSKLEEYIWGTLDCLKEAGNREEDARKLYIKRSAVAPDTASRQFSQGLKALKTLWRSD